MNQAEAERLHMELGYLLMCLPDLSTPTNRASAETHRWLAKTYAIVDAAGKVQDAIEVRSCMDSIGRGLEIEAAKRSLLASAWRTLAILELKAPATAQGMFIGGGQSFDAMKAFGAAVKGASTDVLIIDPYMDEKALTDFAVLIPEKISVRLLAESGKSKPSLQPAVTNWTAQFQGNRPLECRLALAKSLHDRLIIVNKTEVWLISQSLNALAARSPAVIMKLDADTAALKQMAYDQIWQAAGSI